MVMWMVIFITMFVFMIAGIIYLISRVCKTEVIKSIFGKSKAVQRIIATVVVLILAVISYLVIGSINTAIAIVHTLIIWIIIDIIVCIIEKKTHRKLNYNKVFTMAVLILVIYFGLGWYEAHHVVGTQYTVETSKNIEELRIVQLTDAHIGTTFDGEGFAKEMQKVQSENPDIVVITGDYVDDDTSKEDMARACEALGTLEITYGVYYVFGNHDKGYSNEDRGYGAEDLVRNLELNGVNVLQDETVLIGDSFYLIGRQDRSEESLSGKRATVEELVQNLDKEKYMIMLDHQPNDFDAQEKEEVDLVLSGHTHGGQFFPINYLGELTGENDMTYGLRKRENTTFIVSSGISDWAIKFKTGCKSEYVVVDIQPQS